MTYDEIIKERDAALNSETDRELDEWQEKRLIIAGRLNRKEITIEEGIEQFEALNEITKNIEKDIVEQVDAPKQLSLFSFLPTVIARTSPFFPMSKKEMGNRPLYKNLEINNPWGSITFKGPRLAVYDESVLLAVLHIARKKRTSAFNVSFAEICEIMGSKGGKSYNTIFSSLERMAESTVKTVVKIPKSKRKDQDDDNAQHEMIGSILSTVYRRTDDTKGAYIALNESFLLFYGANLTTTIDVKERASLKGDTAKALHRFLRTHRPSSVPFGFKTLAAGINLNIKQPNWRLKQKITAALDELKKHNLIENYEPKDNNKVEITRVEIKVVKD